VGTAEEEYRHFLTAQAGAVLYARELIDQQDKKYSVLMSFAAHSLKTLLDTVAESGSTLEENTRVDKWG